MIKAGVIGHPIAHSKSPRIHGYWLQHFGIAGEYKAYDIPPAMLKDGVSDLVQQGLRGFNVTLPHKQAIMDLCDDVQDDAQKIGAVNTVVIDAHGRLTGRNTDAFGFSQNLKETLPDFDATGTTALVIGAGGASRAVLYALAKLGVSEIRLANRTFDTARDMADLYRNSGAHAIAWESRQDGIEGADLIINTASLGMTGQPPLDLPLNNMKDGAVVYDIVYAPLITPLLAEAKTRGARIVTGIGMLLHQARPGFAAWYGRTPSVTPELEAHVLASSSS